MSQLIASHLPSTWEDKPLYIILHIMFKETWTLAHKWRKHHTSQMRFSAVQRWDGLTVENFSYMLLWVTYLHGHLILTVLSKWDLPMPGIEPGPPGWKPGILTVRPHGTVMSDCIRYPVRFFWTWLENASWCNQSKSLVSAQDRTGDLHRCDNHYTTETMYMIYLEYILDFLLWP